jgi:hypothetical protein
MTKWPKTSFTYLYLGKNVKANIDPNFLVYPYVQEIFVDNVNITFFCAASVFRDLEERIAKELEHQS